MQKGENCFFFVEFVCDCDHDRSVFLVQKKCLGGGEVAKKGGGQSKRPSTVTLTLAGLAGKDKGQRGLSKGLQ